MKIKNINNTTRFFNKTLNRVFEDFRENQKIGRVFEKLGHVFVLQHGSCFPNQPQ